MRQHAALVGEAAAGKSRHVRPLIAPGPENASDVCGSQMSSLSIALYMRLPSPRLASSPNKRIVRNKVIVRQRMVVRRSRFGTFLGCNRFPRCRTIVTMKALDRLKQMQAQGQWPPESPEQAKQILAQFKPEKAAAAKR